jgi:hypothetical protein
MRGSDIYDPLFSQALYPMEILSFEVRAKGLAFLNICTQGASCINTFGLVTLYNYSCP